MTGSVYQFVQSVVESQKLAHLPCLDVGSFDVCGSVRDLFEKYIGLDMREGRNVDVVANAHRIPFKDGEFYVVTCLETLEHDDDPFQTVRELHRVCAPGGHIIITAPSITMTTHHGYPQDYWRFTPDGIRVLVNKMSEEKICEWKGESIHYHGIKH